MYETFDHTADLGLRIAAPDLPTLFSEAARALTSVLVDDPGAVRPTVEIALHVPGSAAAADYLLFDWLTELLYRFDTERFLAAETHVALDEEGLSATVRGETFDPDRHRWLHEVKAVTYHGLAVRATPQGWEAEVIVDI